jgi:hypothetical protein
MVISHQLHLDASGVEIPDAIITEPEWMQARLELISEKILQMMNSFNTNTFIQSWPHGHCCGQMLGLWGVKPIM